MIHKRHSMKEWLCLHPQLNLMGTEKHLSAAFQGNHFTNNTKLSTNLITQQKQVRLPCAQVLYIHAILATP